MFAVERHFRSRSSTWIALVARRTRWRRNRDGRARDQTQRLAANDRTGTCGGDTGRRRHLQWDLRFERRGVG